MVMKTEYKGYNIYKETEPWAIHFNMNYYVDLDCDGKVIHGSTVENCKEQLDEYLMEWEEVNS